jgi:hypothetical protein
MSPSYPGTIVVRRSSPNFATMSVSSSRMMVRWRAVVARIYWKSAICSSSSAASSMIL